jgi:hypothetical protein
MRATSERQQHIAEVVAAAATMKICSLPCRCRARLQKGRSRRSERAWTSSCSWRLLRRDQRRMSLRVGKRRQSRQMMRLQALA